MVKISLTPKAKPVRTTDAACWSKCFINVRCCHYYVWNIPSWISNWTRLKAVGSAQSWLAMYVVSWQHMLQQPERVLISCVCPERALRWLLVTPSVTPRAFAMSQLGLSCSQTGCSCSLSASGAPTQPAELERVSGKTGSHFSSQVEKRWLVLFYQPAI